MKCLFLFVSFLLSISARSQISKSKSFLELSFHVRNEIQGHFISQYGTLPYKTDLKLSGTSLGVDLGYKMLFRKGWYIIPSIGYYKFEVDDITNKSIPATPFGTTKYRSIDYRPDSIPIGYSTKKYHYNNLSLGIALGKEFMLNSKCQFTTDISFNYLLNYSQRYSVGQAIYSTNTKKDLGYLVTGRLGANRTFKKIYIGANLLIPVYKEISKDKVLFDNPDEKFDKWFGGYGFLLKIGCPLN
ncbi:MAG TPA: hypothetical protein VFI29_18005 [Hanamia sp.]|nr:hypothetical protein [Hanamia sp.]